MKFESLRCKQFLGARSLAKLECYLICVKDALHRFEIYPPEWHCLEGISCHSKKKKKISLGKNDLEFIW
jgi:hypothetical protein